MGERKMRNTEVDGKNGRGLGTHDRSRVSGNLLLFNIFLYLCILNFV